MTPEQVTILLAYDEALSPWRSMVAGSWPRPKPRNFNRDKVRLSIYLKDAVIRPGSYKRQIKELLGYKRMSTTAMEAYRSLLVVDSPWAADGICNNIRNLVDGYEVRV